MAVFVLPAIPPALAALGKAAAFVGSALGFAYVANEGINAMSSGEENADSKAQEKLDTAPIADTCVGDCNIPPKCKDITEEMRRTAHVIQKRIDEMTADVFGMAGGARIPGQGNLRGHIKAIKQAKNKLQDEIRRAKNKGCPIPSDVQQALDKEIPG
jgi:hypothetical protein